MVVAVHRDVVAASLAPVVATLRDIEARHGDKPVHGLAPGLLAADPTGWVPATSLTAGTGLPALLDAARKRWDAQPHAAAALAWKCYTYWTALPSIIGFAGSRRVPLPRAENVLVRYSQHQPFLHAALHRPTLAVLASDPLATTGDPRVVVCDDDAGLLTHLRTALIDEHLEPLMAGIRGQVHLGTRTLWGSLASGVAHGLARAADSVPGPILGTIDQVLRALDVADLVDVRVDGTAGQLHIERRTCCLAFTLPEPKVCTGCCIR